MLYSISGSDWTLCTAEAIATVLPMAMRFYLVATKTMVSHCSYKYALTNSRPCPVGS